MHSSSVHKTPFREVTPKGPQFYFRAHLKNWNKVYL
jgi:hypothetical protein